MIAMLLADGEIDDDEVAAVRKIYRELSGKELDEASLRREIGEASARAASIDQILGGFAGMLNSHGQEKVLEAAYLVAVADGEFHESEQAMLTKIGDSLGMSKAHFRGLIQALASGERVEEPAAGISSAPPPLPGA